MLAITSLTILSPVYHAYWRRTDDNIHTYPAYLSDSIS